MLTYSRSIASDFPFPDFPIPPNLTQSIDGNRPPTFSMAESDVEVKNLLVDFTQLPSKIAVVKHFLDPRARSLILARMALARTNSIARSES